MLHCPQCGKVIVGTAELVKHVKYLHNFGHANFPSGLVCPAHSCTSEINSWSWFLRHLKSHEEPVAGVDLVVEDPGAVDIDSSLVSERNEEALHHPAIEEVKNYSRDFGIKVLTEILGNFCSTLLANGINNSTVDLIVKEMQYCFSESFNLIVSIAEQFIQENIEGFSDQIKFLLSVFQKVKSSYQRQKLFDKTETFVSPVEKSLGTRTELRVKGAKRQQVIVSDTFMYVPLLKTLEKIVSCPQFTKYFNQGNNETF